MHAGQKLGIAFIGVAATTYLKFLVVAQHAASLYYSASACTRVDDNSVPMPNGVREPVEYVQCVTGRRDDTGGVLRSGGLGEGVVHALAVLRAVHHALPARRGQPALPRHHLHPQVRNFSYRV